MKITRREIICPSCNGKGIVQSPYPTTACTYETCPACKGSKTIIEETTECEEYKPYERPIFGDHPNYRKDYWGSTCGRTVSG